MEKFWKFIKDEDGLEMTEYAVIGGIIIGAGVVIYLAIGAQINTAMGKIRDALISANAAPSGT